MLPIPIILKIETFGIHSPRTSSLGALDRGLGVSSTDSSACHTAGIEPFLLGHIRPVMLLHASCSLLMILMWLQYSDRPLFINESRTCARVSMTTAPFYATLRLLALTYIDVLCCYKDKTTTTTKKSVPVNSPTG